MHVNISNEQLSVCVGTCGAELLSVQRDGKEYMWRTQNGTWNRTAPILFPLTGRFPNNVYTAEGKERPMPLNGFGRDAEFCVAEFRDEYVRLRLQPDDSILSVYPYEFTLDVTFSLNDNKLSVCFEVENRSQIVMPFSVGYHPGFRCFASGEKNWFLKFETRESLSSFSPFGWSDGLISDCDTKALSKDLFNHGARTVTDVRSKWVELWEDEGKPVLRLYRDQFQFLSFWTLPDEKASFLCIEPSLSVSSSGPSLLDRAGMCVLDPGITLRKIFCIEFF